MAGSSASDSRFGLYLIPPACLLAPLSLAHLMLEREFGCRIAGRFMVHVTVKGFFKPKPAADIERLVSELDETYAEQASFKATFGPPRLITSDRGSSIALPVELSQPLQALQRETWRVIEPYVADDCPFTAVERANAFWPHLTLVQEDLPSDPTLQGLAMELCSDLYAALPSQSWSARDLQFIRFWSDDWQGSWGDSLRFSQLRGWRLAGT